MAGRDPVHDASPYHFVGNLPTRPLANGTFRLAGGLTGQGHHLANLLWGDPCRRPRTRDITQALFNAQILQLRSPRLAAGKPSHRWRHRRTVLRFTLNWLAIWALLSPWAARRMIRDRRATRWGVVWRRTNLSKPSRSSAFSSIIPGFGPRISLTTTLHVRALGAYFIIPYTFLSYAVLVISIIAAVNSAMFVATYSVIVALLPNPALILAYRHDYLLLSI